jgi:hypothetical protein
VASSTASTPRKKYRSFSISVMRVRTDRSLPEPGLPAASRRLRRASASTSFASKVLARPPGSRLLLSRPRLTYAYTVSGFTPSISAVSLVVSRPPGRRGAGS